MQQPGKVARSRGNVDAEFAKGGKVVEATYYVPHHAHATMEPPVAVADFRDGKVTAWAPVQNPQAAQETVAAALGIDKSNVVCHVTLLGGGFGRKSKPDFVAEAALLSKKVGRPVKVVWSREDDLQFDFYHAVAAVSHKAVVDGRGRPTAWLARSAFPPIASTFTAGERYGMDIELGMGLTDLPFDVPAYRAENCPAEAHVRIGWFRSVANIYQVFAASSFVDELAHAAGRDPLEYQLDLHRSRRGARFHGRRRRELLELRRAERQVPVRHAALRRVLEIAARARRLEQALARQGPRHGHRRRAQLHQLHRVGRRSAGRRQGPGAHPARDSGRRCGNGRQPRSRALAVRGRRRHGHRPGDDGRDLRRGRTHDADQLPHVPGAADHRRAGRRSTCTSSRAMRRQAASASRACRRSCRR